MCSKWLAIVLVVSLGLNLALIGFLIARAGAPAAAPARMDPGLAPFRVLRDLPETRQDVLRPLLREQFRGARATVGQIRRAQRAIDAALTAEPFDAAALEQALAGFRSALLTSQEASHAALVELAGAMTAEERALLPGAMRQRPRAAARAEGRTPAPARP